jgi:hypothetical protein
VFRREISMIWKIYSFLGLAFGTAFLFLTVVRGDDPLCGIAGFVAIATAKYVSGGSNDCGI